MNEPSPYTLAYKVLFWAQQANGQSLHIDEIREQLLGSPGIVFPPGTTVDEVIEDLERWELIQIEGEYVNVLPHGTPSEKLLKELEELPKWQSDFYTLLYTKDFDLAIASNSEREVIIDATKMIRQLQEAIEKLTGELLLVDNYCRTNDIDLEQILRGDAEMVHEEESFEYGKAGADHAVDLLARNEYLQAKNKLLIKRAEEAEEDLRICKAENKQLRTEATEEYRELICPKCFAEFEDVGKDFPNGILCPECKGILKGVIHPRKMKRRITQEQWDNVQVKYERSKEALRRAMLIVDDVQMVGGWTKEKKKVYVKLALEGNRG